MTAKWSKGKEAAHRRKFYQRKLVEYEQETGRVRPPDMLVEEWAKELDDTEKLRWAAGKA